MLKGELYEYVNYISISQLPKKKKKNTETKHRLLTGGAFLFGWSPSEAAPGLRFPAGSLLRICGRVDPFARFSMLTRLDRRNLEDRPSSDPSGLQGPNSRTHTPPESCLRTHIPFYL